MRSMRKSILIPLAVILVAGTVAATEAQARLRVSASIDTPGLHVRIGPEKGGCIRDHRVRLEPTRRYDHYQLRRIDRRIAKRLSRFTGVSSRELLGYKRWGYSWREIGNWLELPRPAIRAVMDAKTWKRYLKRQRHHGGRHFVCGNDSRFR